MFLLTFVIVQVVAFLLTVERPADLDQSVGLLEDCLQTLVAKILVTVTMCFVLPSPQIFKRYSLALQPQR